MPGGGRLDRPGSVLSDAQRYVETSEGVADAVVTMLSAFDVGLVRTTSVGGAGDCR